MRALSGNSVRSCLIYLLCPFILLGTAHGASQAPLRENPDHVMSFANFLLAQADYYRAITEYKAFLFLFPGHPRADEARTFMGKAYRAEKQWEQALEAFRLVTRKGEAESEWAPVAALEVGETLLQAGHPVSAARTLEELARSTQRPDIRSRALYRASWCWLSARRWNEADRILSVIEPDSPVAASARELRKRIVEDIPNLPRRSPWVAGGMAAVLPGSGHLYIGRPKEAITSFLLNGTFIAGAVWAIQEGYLVTAGIISFFELGWYLGGISTASRGTGQFNRKQEDMWLKYLQQRWGIDSEVSRSPTGGVLKWSLRF